VVRTVLGLVIADFFARLSLVDWWPVRIPLIVAALLVLVVLVRWARHRTSKIALSVFLVVLVGANALVEVNAYYGPYRTVGQALGYPALPSLDTRLRPSSGVVVAMDIPGQRSHFRARSAQVYVPPAWFARPTPRLPVVVLLHGTPGGPSDWVDSGRAVETADAWAHDHHGVAPIIVMPDINGALDADTECVDSVRGQAETYLSDDVPNFVRSRFVTRDQGRDWAVAGLSEGGSCAVTLALRHSSVYSTFADFGGLAGPRVGTTNDPAGTADGLFAGSQRAFDEHEPAEMLAHARFPGMGGWFAAGSADDEPLTAVRQLSALSGPAGMDTHLMVIPGGHSFDVWQSAFAASLPWIAARLGIADPPPRPAPGPPPHSHPMALGPHLFRAFLRNYLRRTTPTPEPTVDTGPWTRPAP
jgi:S-formylglutathione hydrolase FrmB